ncbi:uncharacterized protein LOC129746169 isoform X4 [Uranotaenia lowii]|uniref:uncharacterized protein LOC129746169 isoform X4 n=1 Tax=Uranotaenia lowii TaxID=190385 RepID=UPI0024797E4F|nr:uncharacterized protein LOC129746169 isoform X4 [Uranotaenia lowii]
MDRPKPFLGYDNNVGLLINKFEVRNYPKNSKMAAMPQFDDSEVFVRARRRNSRDPPIYVNDSGVFYESNDGLPQTRFRNRYTFNESLSSLNESDYGGYEPMIDEYRSEEPPQIINKQQVASSLSRFGAILQMLSKIPFPRLSVTGLGLCSLVAIFICPRTIGANVLFPGFRLLFGTLYPAYASYKAVRTKNVKEYVKWMMYWIVFALFTCIETFTDILLSWFPFYYEIKVILVLWLLSPATRGSSTLYRKFVHPMLTRREQEIDDYINQAKEKGYTAVLQLGSKGVNYATNVIMQTAIKAFNNPSALPSLMPKSHSDNILVSAAAGSDSRHPLFLRDHSEEGSGSGSQVDGPSRGSSRVRRSHSADSALNKVASSGRANTLANHSIIYEIDSEEEEQMLAEAQAAIEQNQLSLATDAIDSALAADFDKESSVETDDGSVKSRVVTKRRTTAGSTASSSSGSTASSNTRAARKTTTGVTSKPAATTRGRKKIRKDSDSMDVDGE